MFLFVYLDEKHVKSEKHYSSYLIWGEKYLQALQLIGK